MISSTAVFMTSAAIIVSIALYLTMAECYRTGLMGSVGFAMMALGFGSMIFEFAGGVRFEMLPQVVMGTAGVAVFMLQHFVRTRRFKKERERILGKRYGAKLHAGPETKMKRQQGFTLAVYLLMALAVLGALASLYALVDRNWETSAGVAKGKVLKQAEWDDANREAQKAADEQKKGDELLAAQKAAELLKANQNAEDYKRKYEAERAQRKREKRPQVFADCSKQQSTGGSNDQAKDTDVTPTLRLSWGFVREWDDAWTGQTGQPLFGVQPGGTGAGERADTPSPLSIDDLSDNHAANADICSKNKRRLNGLTGKIKALQQRWQPQ